MPISIIPPAAKDTTIVDAGVDRLAEAFEKQSDNDYLASLLEDTFSPDLAADILNRLSAIKALAILKSSKLSADRTQAILYKMAEKKYLSKLVDIMTEGAGDVTLATNTTYTGVNRFRTLDLNGYVYVADGQPHVIIAYEIRDSVGSGAITKTATGGGGGAGGYAYGGWGGRGGGGLIVFAHAVNVPTIRANGANGGNGETGSFRQINPGNNGGAGYFIVVGTDEPGTGGNGGGGYAGGGGGGPNGSGATTTDPTYGYDNSGGNGGTITKTTYSTMWELALDVIKSIIDWFIQNVLGKTPSNVKSLPNIRGAGGGGGGTDGYYGAGGGGGSGGQIVIIAITVSVSTIEARGGNGGNGADNTGGGGGGGGGIVYVAYISSGSVTSCDVSGGAGGTSAGTGASGTAGTDGVCRVEQI